MKETPKIKKLIFIAHGAAGVAIKFIFHFYCSMTIVSLVSFSEGNNFIQQQHSFAEFLKNSFVVKDGVHLFRSIGKSKQINLKICSR